MDREYSNGNNKKGNMDRVVIVEVGDDGATWARNPEIGRGFTSALPAELEAAHTREVSPFGKYSPRAAILSGVSKIIDTFSDDETATGRRQAREAVRLGFKGK